MYVCYTHMYVYIYIYTHTCVCVYVCFPGGLGTHSARYPIKPVPKRAGRDSQVLAHILGGLKRSQGSKG